MAIHPETTYPSVLGRVIARKRKALNINQGEAAERAQLPRSTWSRFEVGESTPDAMQIVAIAKALSCTDVDLMQECGDAVKALEKEGIKVHMRSAKAATKGGKTVLALLGAAALGGIIYALSSNDSQDD